MYLEYVLPSSPPAGLAGPAALLEYSRRELLRKTRLATVADVRISKRSASGLAAKLRYLAANEGQVDSIDKANGVGSTALSEEVKTGLASLASAVDSLGDLHKGEVRSGDERSDPVHLCVLKFHAPPPLLVAGATSYRHSYRVGAGLRRQARFHRSCSLPRARHVLRPHLRVHIPRSRQLQLCLGHTPALRLGQSQQEGALSSGHHHQGDSPAVRPPDSGICEGVDADQRVKDSLSDPRDAQEEGVYGPEGEVV